jgi:ABC-type uncharacterized transport system ATPase subunit
LLGERPDYVELKIPPGMDSDIVLKAAMQAGKVTRFELVEPSLQQIFVETVGNNRVNDEDPWVKGGVAS